MEDSVSSIDDGEEQELTFTVDIDEAARGEIPSRLEIRYRTTDTGDNDYKTLNTVLPFDLQIIDAPLLTITTVEPLSDFVGGTVENKVLVTVRNDGLEDAEEVRVRVVPDISYPFIFETTTQYVASKIEPGEEAVVAFVAEVSGDAEDKTYEITTKLESLVGEARYIREDTLALAAKPGESASIGGIGATIIVVVLILALILGIRTYRARKKAKRHAAKKKQH